MIEISGRKIGPGELCYIIAECGVSHLGRIDLAERLIRAAKGAGADAAKFQAWNTARLLSPDSPMYRQLRPLELSEGQLRHLRDVADSEGITFLCTPDQEADADMIDELVPAFKVGSGNLRNLPFLRHVASKGKPILLSTGMATMEDVTAAVHEIELAFGDRTAPLALLHCASVYPKEPDPAARTAIVTHFDASAYNMRAIDAMRDRFGYPVGYSDHALVNCISLAAVARGACLIERHLRLPDYRGIDWLVSVDEAWFAELVFGIRTIESALGDGVKRPMPGEEATREYVESWRKG